MIIPKPSRCLKAMTANGIVPSMTGVSWIATFEIDMWAARGVARGAAARPASPIQTLPDAYGAKAFLAAQPEIDGERIGIMGFSWGGVVTMLSAIGRHAPASPFKAHAANYPVCWVYRRNPALALTGLTGAPVLLQTGSADTYDDPDAGENHTALINKRIDVKDFAGNETRQQMIRSALAQALALIQFLNYCPGVFGALQLSNPDRGHI